MCKRYRRDDVQERTSTVKLSLETRAPRLAGAARCAEARSGEKNGAARFWAPRQRIAHMAGVGTMRAAVVDLHGASSVRAASRGPFQGPALVGPRTAASSQSQAANSRPEHIRIRSPSPDSDIPSILVRSRNSSLCEEEFPQSILKKRSGSQEDLIMDGDISASAGTSGATSR